MAVRRQLGGDREEQDYGYDDGADERFLGDPSGGGFQQSPFDGGFEGAPPVAANEGLIDRSGDYGMPPIDIAEGSREEGNTERGRELAPQDRPTSAPDYSALPRGVSVEETMFPNGEPQAFQSQGVDPMSIQDTPAMSMAPNPVAAQTPQPSLTATAPGMPGGSGTGPSRRTVSNATPALFSETGGSRMFGSSGGLMGGGRGAVGTNRGGPNPTEMMLSILRSLKGGG